MNNNDEEVIYSKNIVATRDKYLGVSGFSDGIITCEIPING